MQQRSDYWTAWMAGWASAIRIIFTAQQRMLAAFLKPPQPPRPEASMPATAGDKPRLARRGRGRLPKGGGSATPRRRGRPAKAKRRRS